MNPYRWNGYVVRMPFIFTPQWVDLAGQDSVLTHLIVCRLVRPGSREGWFFQWVGGDQGYNSAVFLGYDRPGFRWPYGRSVTEYVLPATGDPFP